MLAYFGGGYLMSLKERIMKPLLDAQFEKGIEKGTATAEAEFQAWKERQKAAGVVFAPDPENEDTEAEAR